MTHIEVRPANYTSRKFAPTRAVASVRLPNSRGVSDGSTSSTSDRECMSLEQEVLTTIGGRAAARWY